MRVEAERQCRKRSAQQHQEVFVHLAGAGCADGCERSCAGCLEIDYDDERERRKEECLVQERYYRRLFHVLFYCRVDRECERETERDSRELLVVEQNVDDRDDGKDERREFELAHVLFEYERAEQADYDRLDVVADAGLDYVVGVYRPDVDGPVRGDERTRNDVFCEDLFVAERLKECVLSVLYRCYHKAYECHGKYAVKDDDIRSDWAQQVPIDGEHAPNNLAKQRRSEPLAIFLFCVNSVQNLYSEFLSQ